MEAFSRKCETCGQSVRAAPVTRKWVVEEHRFCSGRCAAEFDRGCEDPFAWVTYDLEGFLAPPEAPPRVRREKGAEAMEVAA
jgi:hypothetical protein